MNGSIVEDQVKKGFDDVDQFVSFLLSVQNRRKSRMGYSLQNQLAALFDLHRLKYEPQGLTEGKNKPDFLFPSSQSYHDASFRSVIVSNAGSQVVLEGTLETDPHGSGEDPRKAPVHSRARDLRRSN